MRCCVVIPARNEAGAVGNVIERIHATLEADVIVVDNGSTDETFSVATAAGARVVREVRRGYGYACLAGIAAARDADALVFIDGDGSMAPEEIPVLLAPIEAGRADIVCGSRRRLRQPGSMPAHQAFGNQLCVTLLRTLYRVRLSDLGPFRAARATTLHSLHLRPTRFTFLADMLARGARTGARIEEVSISYGPRIAGRSKVSGSLRGSIEAGAAILASLAWNRIARID